MAVVEPPLSHTDFDDADWQSAIATASKKTDFEYWIALSNRHREAEAANEIRKARVYSLLAMVMGVELKPDDVKVPFVPRFTVASIHGPGIDDLAEDELAALELIAENVADPEVRARICDVLWVKKKRFKLIELIVKSYLVSADALYDPECWFDCERRYRRAVKLGRTLGSAGSTVFPMAVKAVEERLTQLDADDGFGLSCRLMELLQEVGQGDARKYAEMAAKGARKAEAEGGFALDRARCYWLCAARWHAMAGDGAAATVAMIEAAETFEKRATEALCQPQSRSPHLTAANHLKDAVDALRKVGTPDAVLRADTLYLRLVEAQRRAPSEMIRSAQTLDITESAKLAKDEVAGLSVPQALFKVALLAAPPSVVSLKKDAEARLKKVPLAALLLNFTKLSATGKVVASTAHRDSSLSVKDHGILAEMHSQAGIWYTISAAGTLAPAVHVISMEHDIRLQEFIAFAQQCHFVPPGRELTFAKGLYAGYTEDLITSTHLLIPQIEAAIRYQLEQRQVIVSGFNRSGQQNESDLNTMLYLPEIERVYDADMLFTLRSLLTEQLGQNFRNLMAHGMLSDGELMSNVSVYLWAFTLRLCFYPPLDRRPSENLPAEDACTPPA